MKHFSLKIAAISAALVLLGAGCGSADEPVTPPAAAGPQPETTAVTFNPKGLDKKDVTIDIGDIIEFRNSDLKPHQPASNPHPSHTGYPEFDAKKEIAPGETWSFTFTKVGTWKFHDHAMPASRAFQGTITVK